MVPSVRERRAERENGRNERSLPRVCMPPWPVQSFPADARPVSACPKRPLLTSPHPRGPGPRSRPGFAPGPRTQKAEGSSFSMGRVSFFQSTINTTYTHNMDGHGDEPAATSSSQGAALMESLHRLHVESGGDVPSTFRAQLSDLSDGRADEAPSTRGDVDEIDGDSAHQQRRHLPPVSSDRHLREGYGFRPASGASTPLSHRGIASPLPDPHGLGWPGEWYLSSTYPNLRTRSLTQALYPSLKQRAHLVIV
jgi:hypothetical protein